MIVDTRWPTSLSHIFHFLTQDNLSLYVLQSSWNYRSTTLCCVVGAKTPLHDTQGPLSSKVQRWKRAIEARTSGIPLLWRRFITIHAMWCTRAMICCKKARMCSWRWRVRSTTLSRKLSGGTLRLVCAGISQKKEVLGFIKVEVTVVVCGCARVGAQKHLWWIE